MSEVTLKAIADLLHKELEPINTRLGAIEETVSGHTGALVEIAKDVRDLKDGMIVANRRFDKHEEALKFTAEKVGILPEVKRIIEA